MYMINLSGHNDNLVRFENKSGKMCTSVKADNYTIEGVYLKDMINLTSINNITNCSGDIKFDENLENEAGVIIEGDGECGNQEKIFHPSYFGIHLAVPEWEAIGTVIILSIIIMLTIIGNVLVILSVFTYKPLRIVQNFFIVSLAVADLTVAVLVLPFNVAYSILGRWEFGIHLCKMWLTCDVMCCTSSILNLCVIALDRYWAITDSINYAQKRTVERVLLLIAGVWILSLIISSPPLIGWNDWPEEWSSEYPCQLTSNQGYVIYSSLGSFYIPLIIMTIVYIEIYIATRRRLRERSKASRINAIQNLKTPCGSKDARTSEKKCNQNQDQDSISSETNHNENNHDGNQGNFHSSSDKLEKKAAKQKKITLKASNNSSADNTNGRKGKSRKSLKPKIKDSLRHFDRGRKNLDIPSQPTTCEESLISDGNPENLSEDAKINVDGNGNTTEEEKQTSFDDNNSRIAAAKALRKSFRKSSFKKPQGIYQFIEERQKISLSKERRAARTLGIIMGVFVVCWLPFFLMYVILPFCPTCCPTDKFINFITWLGYINSGLNPVIYTIFNLDYRRAFKKLLGIRH